MIDLLARVRYARPEQAEQTDRTVAIWRRVQAGEPIERHDWLWRVDEAFRVSAYVPRAAAGYGLKLFHPDWPDGMSARDWWGELEDSLEEMTTYERQRRAIQLSIAVRSMLTRYGSAEFRSALIHHSDAERARWVRAASRRMAATMRLADALVELAVTP